jgi:hypothetical protein
MASSTLSYTSSIGVLSTLFASSNSFLRLSLQINSIRGFIIPKYIPSPNIFYPTGETPSNIIHAFDDEENTCPGQMPGYFYCPSRLAALSWLLASPIMISNLNLPMYGYMRTWLSLVFCLPAGHADNLNFDGTHALKFFLGEVVAVTSVVLDKDIQCR